MSQNLSTIDSYLAFVAILVNFVFAILVMVRTSRSIVHITFLLICLSVVGWNLGEFMSSATGNPSWSFLSLITSALLPTLMFHFVITQVSPQQKNPIWILIAYTFSFILIMSPFLLQLHPEEASWNLLYFILFVPLFLSILFMLIGAIRRARSQDDKSRFRYMLIAGIIGVITVVTDHIYHLKPLVPPLGHIGSLLYSSILAIGVFKHRTTYDILAQTRERLEDLSTMAAGIAHEIRNPLTSIKGASSLLGRELQSLNHSTCQEYCGLIIEEIDRIDHILNNFRYFTKPLTIEKDLVSVSDVIQKTVKLADVGLFNLEIRLELFQEAVMVQADAFLMKQVLLNLIKNASEACGSEGELVIRTEIISRFVKITFSDNGPGIPVDFIGQIFEPFFTTKATGMGLGLAITQKIIEAHHGRIEVTNLLPRGAEFSIFLPV